MKSPRTATSSGLRFGTSLVRSRTSGVNPSIVSLPNASLVESGGGPSVHHLIAVLLETRRHLPGGAAESGGAPGSDRRLAARLTRRPGAAIHGACPRRQRSSGRP